MITEKDIEYITDKYKTFYKGVIESTDDPDKMGRVRVRLLGVHSLNLEDVPTSTLPWANVLQSLAFGGFNSGVGISGTPICGTWVLCTIDNNDYSNIIVLGALSGINSEKINGFGFTDPNGVYPKNEYIGKSDINQDVINEDYNNTYVIETPGGHKIKINDSTGYIKIYHSSGKNVELNNDKIIVKSPDILLDGNVDITGNVAVNGKADVNGIITSDTDVVTNLISLKSHKTSGVKAGSEVSGTPIP